MDLPRKILVTGGSSFLGQHVVPKLRFFAHQIIGSRNLKENYTADPKVEILTPSSEELNLLDANQVIAYLEEHRPDTILHMAARCGGIGANKDAPGEFIHDNMDDLDDTITSQDVEFDNFWQVWFRIGRPDL